MIRCEAALSACFKGSPRSLPRLETDASAGGLTWGKHPYCKPQRPALRLTACCCLIGMQVMIANIGPAVYNFDETVTTLRFADRAKNIKNKPRINEDPKDAKLREYQDEISK